MKNENEYEIRVVTRGLVMDHDNKVVGYRLFTVE